MLKLFVQIFNQFKEKHKIEEQKRHFLCKNDDNRCHLDYNLLFGVWLSLLLLYVLLKPNW